MEDMCIILLPSSWVVGMWGRYSGNAIAIKLLALSNYSFIIAPTEKIALRVNCLEKIIHFFLFLWLNIIHFFLFLWLNIWQQITYPNIFPYQMQPLINSLMIFLLFKSLSLFYSYNASLLSLRIFLRVVIHL